MADWTTLPDTAVGIGGLPSGTTVTALRDNPVAIAEGAAGAPRIAGQTGPAVQTGGLFNSAVTAAKLATGNAERDWVLARTAGASFGAVGTYAFLYSSEIPNVVQGQTYAGSTLFPAGLDNGTRPDPDTQGPIAGVRGGSSVSGTWRAMGRSSVSAVVTRARYTIYLRIS